ncbi:hypothetical protein BDD12DRAFT_845289 [Trichophaea hybrida]|nr:hypothetical protein BDD12DRAFT_845289 [Trichophaea hybrida]
MTCLLLLLNSSLYSSLPLVSTLPPLSVAKNTSPLLLALPRATVQSLAYITFDLLLLPSPTFACVFPTKLGDVRVVGRWYKARGLRN